SWRSSRGWLIGLPRQRISPSKEITDHPNQESQTARKPPCTPGFLAKSITCSGQIIAIDQSLPHSSRTTMWPAKRNVVPHGGLRPALGFLVMGGVLVLAVPSGASAQSCAAEPAPLQILGSAGPAFNKDRASSSYLLWIDGKARMLVDMGGGAYLRLAQSGAKLSDLVLIGISHLHPDHVSDLPALLWLSHLQRKQPLPLAGPSAGLGVSGPAGIDVAPDFATFLARMFDERNGAFQVMGGALGAAKGAGVPLKVSVVDVLKAEPSAVFEGEGLKV